MARRRFLLAAACALSLPVALAVPMAAAQAAPSPTGLQARNVAACPTPPDGASARCHAVVHELVDSSGRPVPQATSGTPAGYGPADLQAAYALATSSASLGAGKTVALVDAYDDPNAASDVATYRAQFGLPTLASCTVTATSVTSPVSGPCFAKVNQNGSTSSHPKANGGWAQEESLDVDMVSAICPLCNILLVEASSSSFGNLGTAVDTAATLGAVAISNSYGSSGDASDATYGAYYNHPGIAVTASTGDNGYGVGYPATSDFTVAVGGTTLTPDTTASRGWAESAWSGAGSGCSSYQSEPAWQQTEGITACGSFRGIADVSADADPNTGVAVYDSYSYQGLSGWLVFGGTSVASPVIASVYALAGATGSNSTTSYPAALPYAAAIPGYSATNGLNDVTGGSNGSCSPTVLCTAGSGWDGPTGLGTPSGIAAFGGTGGGGTTTAPAAPTGLTATAGNATVGLTWTASTGATSYDVYRGTSAGGESSTPLATGVTSTSYSDATVSNGTTYYYEVTAVNSVGASGVSNEASATPSAPTTTTMSVTSISYALTGNRKALLVTVTVEANSVPVSGATVGATIDLNGSAYASGSGTTGSNGTVTFRINHPHSGTYTTTITSAVATGFSWDGITPANSFTL